MRAKPLWRLDLGDAAPEFRLPSTGDGAGRGGPTREIALADYRGRRHVVLAFYPAAFTPV
jgi:peroxiredoxin